MRNIKDVTGQVEGQPYEPVLTIIVENTHKHQRVLQQQH